MAEGDAGEDQQKDDGPDGVVDVRRGLAAEHLQAEEDDDDGRSEPPPVGEDVSKLRKCSGEGAHAGPG